MSRPVVVLVLWAAILSAAAISGALPRSSGAVRGVQPGSVRPRLYGLGISSGRGFAGDNSLLATVSPNGDGLRDRALVHFRLMHPATVTLDAIALSKHPRTIWSSSRHFAAGNATFTWVPASNTPTRTYVLRLSLIRAGKVVAVYGSLSHRRSLATPGPVVRVQSLDASFRQTSYAPGATARMQVATDASAFTLQFFRAGQETQPTLGYAMQGVAVSSPRQVDWSTHRNSPAALLTHIGSWPNGIYVARLTALDGRVGYAPFLVQPPRYGTHRVAVVVHTDTWQAYNHQDVDGDGWGDTWYASDDVHTVDLTRAFIHGGSPPHWRRYELPFLHWLYASGKQVDFLADEDLNRFRDPQALARAYDLLVFPGHEEYVSAHEYDLVEGFRNLGGNLMFLSSTNFLWRVDRHGQRITRVAKWRTLHRPEARLIGVQYRGNDEGEHRAPYTLTPAGRSSWAFVGVDERAVAAWLWFGIEVDMRTATSPRGTQVLARVNPHYRDGGARGEMTYYERGGAKVFASGALNFTASLFDPNFRRLLENVWERLAEP